MTALLSQCQTECNRSCASHSQAFRMKSNKRRVLFKQAPAADANAQEPPEADYVMTLLDLDDDLSLSDSSDGNEDQDLDLLPDDDRNRELDGQQPTKKAKLTTPRPRSSTTASSSSERPVAAAAVDDFILIEEPNEAAAELQQELLGIRKVAHVSNASFRRPLLSHLLKR